MRFKTAIGGIFGVLLVHAFALVTHLYYFWEPFDIPMHFSGGLVMGLLGIAIYDYLHAEPAPNNHPHWYKYLFVISFAIMVAVFWEFHEYLLDQTIVVWMNWNQTQPSLGDTILDLLMGTIGATCAAVIFRNK
ncbi:hypothetical protein KJ611_04355 [Patescibacteria group bacterium]|nr:hypothetical protein [Patescibacteria group bacterium]MBU1705324.1 hypothetical protein [Patescibacteria group bacterium]